MFFREKLTKQRDAIERLEVCIIALHALKESICRTLSVQWEKIIDAITVNRHPPFETQTGRGRPRFHITKEQLLYLSSMSFIWSDISIMLGVSRMTIYRRRLQYGLMENPRNVFTEAQLHALVQEIKHGQPELGEVMIMGRIRSMGYSDRLRQAIRLS